MNGIVYVIYLAVTVYAWLIVARAVLSWLQLRPGTVAFRIYRVLFNVTEPYLGIFRRALPILRVGRAGIDLTPIVALVVLLVVIQILPLF